MNDRPVNDSAARVAAAGERLRRELLDGLRGAARAEGAGVHTELMMFYGQAFANVLRALSDPLSPTLSAAVRHECVCGLAVHRRWLLCATPLDPQDGYARLAGHWRAVLELLLQGDG